MPSAMQPQNAVPDVGPIKSPYAGVQGNPFMMGQQNTNPQMQLGGQPFSGKGVALTKDDITTLRNGGASDVAVFNSAYKVDPDFRAAADKVIQGLPQLNSLEQKQIPSLILNGYYNGKLPIPKDNPHVAIVNAAVESHDNQTAPPGVDQAEASAPQPLQSEGPLTQDNWMKQLDAQVNPPSASTPSKPGNDYASLPPAQQFDRTLQNMRQVGGLARVGADVLEGLSNLPEEAKQFLASAWAHPIITGGMALTGSVSPTAVLPLAAGLPIAGEVMHGINVGTDLAVNGLQSLYKTITGSNPPAPFGEQPNAEERAKTEPLEQLAEGSAGTIKNIFTNPEDAVSHHLLSSALVIAPLLHLGGQLTEPNESVQNTPGNGVVSTVTKGIQNGAVSKFLTSAGDAIMSPITDTAKFFASGLKKFGGTEMGAPFADFLAQKQAEYSAVGAKVVKFMVGGGISDNQAQDLSTYFGTKANIPNDPEKLLQVMKDDQTDLGLKIGKSFTALDKAGNTVDVSDAASNVEGALKENEGRPIVQGALSKLRGILTRGTVDDQGGEPLSASSPNPNLGSSVTSLKPTEAWKIQQEIASSPEYRAGKDVSGVGDDAVVARAYRQAYKDIANSLEETIGGKAQEGSIKTPEGETITTKVPPKTSQLAIDRRTYSALLDAEDSLQARVDKMASQPMIRPNGLWKMTGGAVISGAIRMFGLNAGMKFLQSPGFFAGLTSLGPNALGVLERIGAGDPELTNAFINSLITAGQAGKATQQATGNAPEDYSKLTVPQTPGFSPSSFHY